MTKVKVNKGGKLMKRMFFFVFFVAVMAAWCTPSFAARQEIAAGTATPAALSTEGINEGVDMTGGVKTLTVGDGEDIYKNNKKADGTATTPGADAVSTWADYQSTITFGGSSNVYGKIGG